jgi:hypothetical protein
MGDFFKQRSVPSDLSKRISTHFNQTGKRNLDKRQVAIIEGTRPPAAAAAAAARRRRCQPHAWPADAAHSLRQPGACVRACVLLGLSLAAPRAGTRRRAAKRPAQLASCGCTHHGSQSGKHWGNAAGAAGCTGCLPPQPNIKNTSPDPPNSPRPAELSTNLRTELVLWLHRDLLSRLPFFQGKNLQGASLLLTRLRLECFHEVRAAPHHLPALARLPAARPATQPAAAARCSVSRHACQPASAGRHGGAAGRPRQRHLLHRWAALLVLLRCVSAPAPDMAGGKSSCCLHPC